MIVTSPGVGNTNAAVVRRVADQTRSVAPSAPKSVKNGQPGADASISGYPARFLGELAGLGDLAVAERGIFHGRLR